MGTDIHNIGLNVKLTKRIAALEAMLNDFVTEYCDREGDEDYPVEAEQQSNELVKDAMILLGIIN